MLTQFESRKRDSDGVFTEKKSEETDVIDIRKDQKYTEIVAAIKETSSKQQEEVINCFNEALDEDKILDMNRIILRLPDYQKYIIPFLNMNPEITALNVSNNIFEKNISNFLFRNIKNIRELSINDSLICADGAKILSENEILEGLSISNTTVLEENSDIDSDEEENIILKYIAKSKSIKTLDISHCYYKPIDIFNLCKNNYITYLDISNFKGKLTSEVLTAISKNPILETLCLNNGTIGDNGISMLAKTNSIKNLEIYNNNNITDKAAFSLSKNTTISRLEVSFCNIGFAGAKALINNCNIIDLDLNYNKILPDEAKLLLEIANKRPVKIEISIECDEPKRDNKRRNIKK
jgi:hypothetical protein